METYLNKVNIITKPKCICSHSKEEHNMGRGFCRYLKCKSSCYCNCKKYVEKK